MYYIGEEQVRNAIQEYLDRDISGDDWSVIKIWVPCDHMEDGDLIDYLAPIKATLNALDFLFAN